MAPPLHQERQEPSEVHWSQHQLGPLSPEHHETHQDGGDFSPGLQGMQECQLINNG